MKDDNCYKKFFWSLLFLTAFTLIKGQDEQTLDSLKKSLSVTPNDTNKVNTYLDLGYVYQWSNPDSALVYAMPGLALARKLDFETGEYDLLLPVVEALSMKGNYSKALQYRFRSLELANRLKDRTKIANSIALIGLVYARSKDYDKALEYYYEAQKTNAVTLGGPQLLNGFIGEAYFHLNKWDSALVYIQRAYELDLKATNFHWCVPYHDLAAIYEQKGNLAKALDLYKESLAISSNNADTLDNYNGIASVYKKSGQTDSAIFYAKQVISQGVRVSILAPVIEASTLLVDIYRSTHNTDSAFKYEETLLANKDSLFSEDKVKQMQNVTFDEQLRQQEIGIEKDKYRNKIKLYSLVAALAVFVIIGIILWGTNRSKKRANSLLNSKNNEVEFAISELKETQRQLVQREKMAALGELTAGIAHEIQNPLNFVNNFSDINKELIEEIKSQKSELKSEELDELLDNIASNEEKINHHGRRADAIVKGMLQHSRTTSTTKEPADINALVDEYLRLAYHGLRAKDKSFNATMQTAYDETIGKINIIPQDIGRVVLNIITNAFHAVTERRKLTVAGYEPVVSVTTRKIGSTPADAGIEIKVADNGGGIPKNIIAKIFQPFFTTKPTGQGTGLGLSLSYDIVKAHGGEILVQTEVEKGSEFIIQLPF